MTKYAAEIVSCPSFRHFVIAPSREAASQVLRKLIPGELRYPVAAGRCYVPCLVRRPGDTDNAVPVMAMVDSGAHSSAISQRLAAFVGLDIVGQCQISTPSGWSMVPAYRGTIELCAQGFGPVAAAIIDDARLCELATPMANAPLLLGMDALGAGIKLTIRPDATFSIEL